MNREMWSRLENVTINAHQGVVAGIDNDKLFTSFLGGQDIQCKHDELTI